MRSLKEQLYFIWKKLSEKQSRKRYSADHFKADIERYENCNQLKPASQIAREKKALQKYWGCYPFQYYRFNMYRKDCPLSTEEMLKYIPAFFAYNLFLPLSFKDYGVLCEDKSLTQAVLTGYGLKQPNMILRYEQQKFFNQFNSLICDDEANKIISNSKAAKLFIKPSFGLGGHGIVVFNSTNDRSFVNERHIVLNASFFKCSLKNNPYIVQEGIMQHEELNKIYPHAVNTFRVITVYENGEAKVLYAVLRMGCGGMQIDNSSSGGIFVKIDIETGAFADHAGGFDHKIYTQHPDTGFVFKDAKVELWHEVKRFTLCAAEKFRSIKYLGWDIAASTEGPLIIEINNGPDLIGLQHIYGGIKDDLRIEPKQWWYNKNYTLRNL